MQAVALEADKDALYLLTVEVPGTYHLVTIDTTNGVITHAVDMQNNSDVTFLSFYGR